MDVTKNEQLILKKIAQNQNDLVKGMQSHSMQSVCQ